MNILVAHDFYQGRGVDDVICQSEVRLLRETGHHVLEYIRLNDEIRDYSLFENVTLSCGSSGEFWYKPIQDTAFCTGDRSPWCTGQGFPALHPAHSADGASGRSAYISFEDGLSKPAGRLSMRKPDFQFAYQGRPMKHKVIANVD